MYRISFFADHKQRAFCSGFVADQSSRVAALFTGDAGRRLHIGGRRADSQQRVTVRLHVPAENTALAGVLILVLLDTVVYYNSSFREF